MARHLALHIEEIVIAIVEAEILSIELDGDRPHVWCKHA
jgi:hypothetical protein